jgi:hypothetical protein
MVLDPFLSDVKMFQKISYLLRAAKKGKRLSFLKKRVVSV